MRKKVPATVQKFFQKEMPPEVLEFFRQQGREGGKIGGRRSLETMTPAERRKRAQKAGAASVAARKRRRGQGT